MFYLLLSALNSIALVFLFKWFERHRIDIFQAIVFNYYVCLLTGWVLAPTGSFDNLGSVWHEPWLGGAVLLGTLFITCFPLIGLSVQRNGTAVSTIAGRTSMVLPVAAAVWLYGDTLPPAKIIGMLLAIAAVYLTNIKPTGSKFSLEDAAYLPPNLPSPKHELPLASPEQVLHIPANVTPHPHPHLLPEHWYWVLPPVIFVMNGIIEITINYTQKMLLPDTRHVVFTMSLFLVAGTIGTIILLYRLLRRQAVVRWQNTVGGIALGIPNYLSIYFFLQALSKSGWQSSVVIPVNNIAVVLGSCLGAWWLFGEKMSSLNIAGMLLASLAIALIAG